MICSEMEFPEERPIRVYNLRTNESMIFWAENRAQACVRAASFWGIPQKETSPKRPHTP